MPPVRPPAKPDHIVLPKGLHLFTTEGAAVSAQAPTVSRAPPLPGEAAAMSASPPSDSHQPAIIVGVVLLLAVVAAVAVMCRRVLMLPRSIETAEDSSVVTHVYIEDDSCACDFDIRLEHRDLSSMDVLLEVISNAAFQATEVPLDFSSAHVERLDAKGSGRDVLTDADCAALQSAAGIRIFTSEGCRARVQGGVRSMATTSGRSAPYDGVLLAPHEEHRRDDEAERGVEKSRLLEELSRSYSTAI